MSDGSSSPDVVTVAAPGSRTEPHKPRRAVLLVSAAAIALAATAGAVFGFAMEKSRVFEPGIILGQMQLRNFQMLKIFLTAVTTGPVSSP